MTLPYSIVIQWSEIDRVFVVTIPEFADRVAMPCTEGKTYEEAIQSAQEVISTFLEIWQEKGEPIPQPQGLLIA
jgi:antitoxin HicB